MEEHITKMIAYMTQSHQQIARLLEAKRQVAAHMAHLIHEIPDRGMTFNDVDGIVKNSSEITKSITLYLNGLADLEDAIADNLMLIMKEMSEQSAEE